MTVAELKSVAKMSPWRMVALPGPTPATPAACALALACFAISGLYSMPVALAPNFFAAAMAILPSPAPRSKWMSPGPVCAMVSMRSTPSSGVGTQITSLPAWPTCGSNFGGCCWASAGAAATNAAASRAKTRFISENPRKKGLRNVADYFLQGSRRVVGEARALAAGERDVAGVHPVLHAVDDVGQARAALGEIGRVDLRDVAEAHHLGAGAGARHHGLHRLRREVLRLVDDQPFADEGAAAHEIERLHLDPRGHQVARRRAAPLAAAL